MEKTKDKNIITSNKQSSKQAYLSQYENTIMKMFAKNYNSTKEDYITHIIDRLVFNVDCHLVATFKDHMIFDYLDEYLKREYNIEESLERVPKFASFYKNYLMFFCKPIFKDFYLNELIQNYGERKAELYYDQNFKDNHHKELEDPFQDLDYDEDRLDYTRSLMPNTIFNTSVKDTIDNHPIITNHDSLMISIIQKSNKKEESEQQATLTFNNETLLNDSGLFNPYSNEQSLVYMMKQIQKKKTKENEKKKTKENEKEKDKDKNNKGKEKEIEKETSITKLNRHLQENPFKVLRKESEFKSNLVSYTKLCKNPLLINNAFKQLQSFNNKSQAQLKIKEIDKDNNNKEISKAKSRNYSGKSDFKTYDHNRKTLIKTQNMENLISRIAQQVNSNLHYKQVHSIDNSSKKPIASLVHSKTKSFCNLTKIDRINSCKSKQSNPVSSHKTNSLSQYKIPTNDPHKQSSCNHNDDFMKITLALLMDNSKQIKNSSSHSRVAGSSKHIQNVNINISNQININSNVQLQETLSPKLMKNDRVEVNIQSNLNKLFNSAKGKVLSRNRDNQSTSVGHINDPSDNGTIGKKVCMWNNTNTVSTSNKNNIIFSSCSNLEKLRKKNYSRNKTSSRNNNNTLQKHLSKSLSKTNNTNIPKSKIAFTSHQFIQGIKKMKAAPYCCSIKNNTSQSKQSIKNK